MTLLRKELRQLTPMIVFIFLFMSLNLIFEPITNRPDESEWVRVSGGLEPGDGTATAILLLVFSLMTAFSLFPREHDEGTIEFLHSLPVSRGHIFLSKISAALLILIIGLYYGMMIDWLTQLLNNQSFTGEQFNISIAIRTEFLHSAYIFIVFSHGVLLSFFRRFGLIIYGTIWWILETVNEISPSFEYVNFMNLIDFEYHGQTLLIPWLPLMLHMAAGLICLSIAGLLWTGSAERFTFWYGLLFKKLWGRLLLAAGIAGIIILSISFGYKSSKDYEYSEVSYQSFSTARFTTEHYKFTYPSNLRETALSFIESADEAYNTVKRAFNAQTTSPVVIDLTEESSEHAGIAGWKIIRMDIRGGKPQSNYLRILHHETVHVFASHESKRRIGDHQNSTVFFNEGLAEYISFKAVPHAERLKSKRLIAAISWKRHRIKFSDLADAESFRKKHSETLFYSLGETWAMSLASVCGELSLGDTLRAMSRKNAPKELKGEICWNDTLQSIGCDLERVNAYWLENLSKTCRDYQEEVDRIPKLSGSVTGKKGRWVILTAVTDRPVKSAEYTEYTESRFFIRIRNSSSTEETDVRTFKGFPRQGSDPLKIEFQVPKYILAGNRFEYQFGYLFDPDVLPYYELWQSARIP